MRTPPTFVAPAVSALGWAGGFTAAMVAHHPIGWLCLIPYCWRVWQAITRLNTYIEAKVRAECTSCGGRRWATIRRDNITYASGPCRCVGGSVWAK